MRVVIVYVLFVDRNGAYRRGFSFEVREIEEVIHREKIIHGVARI